MASIVKQRNPQIPALDPNECEHCLYWATERLVEPEYMDARLQAERYCVAWLVLQGSVRVIDSGGKVDVFAGHWIFVGKIDGRQRFAAGSRILSIRFTLRNRGGEDLIPRDHHVVIRASKLPHLEERARALMATLQPWTTSGNFASARDRISLSANLEIEAAFCRWLSVYVEAMAESGARVSFRKIADPRVLKALTLIEQHPPTERIRIAEVAQICGLGVNRLGTLFKQTTGKSPHAYYESLRLQRAQNLLADTESTIKQITWELGFGSAQHFSNWFKQHTGEGPKAFRISSHGQS